MTQKIVLHVVGAMNVGGTETMLMNLYRNIDRERYQFHFLSYSSEKAVYDDEIESLGGVIHRISSPFNFFEFHRIIRSIKCLEVLHLHTYFSCGISALYGKLSGVNMIISHSHTSLPIMGGGVNILYSALSRALIKIMSDQLTACSEKAAVSLFGKGVEYKYIPNFIDPNKYIEYNQVVTPVYDANIITVGHVGRFSDAKNHDFILECAEYSKLNNLPLKFVLVGTGPNFTRITNIVASKSLHKYISLLGQRSDIPQLLHSFDKFILPSHFEGFGLVLVEAQATGKECIVSPAIQPEAILDLGLVTQLELDPKEWCSELLTPVKAPPSRNARISSITRAKMDLKSIISLFKELYEN